MDIIDWKSFMMPWNGYHSLGTRLGYLGMDIIGWKPLYDASEWIS